MSLEQHLNTLSKGPTKSEENKLEAIEAKIRPIINNYKEHLSEEKRKYWDSIKIYLQGSFANDTDIKEDSDIDIVLELQGIFRYDDSSLDIDSKKRRNEYYSRPSYDFSEFKNDVYKAIQTYYNNDNAYFRTGKKSIKIKHNKAEADIIPCFQCKKFLDFTGSEDTSKIIKGISFDTEDGETITSYPQLHLQSCKKKEEETYKAYKSTVRIFKNIKSILIDKKVINDKLACSYYIENLIYNLPNNLLLNYNFTSTVENIYYYLATKHNNNNSEFILAHGQNYLFSEKNWNKKDCIHFLREINKYLMDYDR